MKYIIAFLALHFATTSCTSQTVKDQFMNVLTLPSNTNVSYGNDGGDKILVRYPLIDVAEEMVNATDLLINTDLSIPTTECGKYLSILKLKTYSHNFISIQKSLSYMFCPASDDIEYETFNLFRANDGIVYRINLKKNSYVMGEINKFISTADVDCNYSNEDIYSYLLFENNIPKLFIVKDKVCNAIIGLDINKLEFIFTNSSGGFPVVDTFIVN